ncbi:GDP-mannose 4,6-dehydratase [Candidatus Pelagibacter sp.]|nr:GDP-mannose 4,6-dehydratase [Candidatus Pelagibacter sp.]
MTILVTGAAGFIGNNFSIQLANKKNVKILGIDNINNYYSTKIKNLRIERLKTKKNIKFYKIDLQDEKKLKNLFKKHNITEVYNFAAQAGVRYSLENPKAYVDSNIVGFSNLISLSKKYKVKKFFFASSSSVYGDNVKFPIKESAKLNPKNPYGLSKKYNEEIAEIYYENYNFKSTALRFFTVFGEWGRPDMFIIKYLNCAYNKKTFPLNNYGNHLRDFTYIDDVIKTILSLRNKKLNGFEVFNICSNKPVSLTKIISFLKNKIPKVKIKKRGMQKADIYKTHGDNSRVIKKSGLKNYTKFEIAMSRTHMWFKKNSKMFT